MSFCHQSIICRINASFSCEFPHVFNEIFTIATLFRILEGMTLSTVFPTSSNDPFFEKYSRIRKALHQRPEPSGAETDTARRVAAWLRETGPDALIESVGGTGLCAVYKAAQPGPTLLFRAELDALPIAERNDFAHRSQEEGVSHKCGHDGHMSILLALAGCLQAERPKRGQVVLLFQPEEETGQGAAKMLADQRLLALQADRVFALHNLPGYPLGEVQLREGAFAAASEGILFRFEGKTAHAGHPEQGISPAAALADLLQQLPALATQFPDFALITVVECRLGERNFGISPGNATLACTVRAFEQATFDALKAAAIDLVERTAANHQLNLAVSLHEGFAAVQNQAAAVQQVAAACQQLKIPHQYAPEPFRWSEDFGLFTQVYPGALFGLGAGIDFPALHHPDYDFPDALIRIGSDIFYQMIQEELG